MKDIIQQISSYIQEKYFPNEKWEVVERNHFGGFMFGPKDIFPLDEETKIFTLKFDKGFLYLSTTFDHAFSILVDIQNKFNELINETDYFVYAYNINPNENYKKLPLKAQGENAKYLLNILKAVENDYMYNINLHGILNIIKDDIYYRIEPVFERMFDNPPSLIVTESVKVINSLDDWKKKIN